MAGGKPHWQIDTDTLARNIRKATRRARTEEDVKMAVEPLLRSAFEEAGIDVEIAQYEKRTATAVRPKRMDAVYGYLILEYKALGKLGTPAGIRQATEQLQDYLEAEASPHPKKEDFLEKAVGVAIDGERILFARYSKGARILSTPVPVEGTQPEFFATTKAKGGFQFQGPYPISRSSLASLIVYVRSAARRPLTAEHLADVFGPGNEVTRLVVSEFYSAVMRGQRRSKLPRVATFYNEWNRIFGVVYGEKLSKAEKAVEETARLYSLPSGVRLKPLLFAIHTFYAFLMKLIAVELLAIQDGFATASFVVGLAPEDDKTIRARLDDLERGRGFTNRGIENFLEADFFSWYLDAWSARMARVVRGVIRALADFEPATPILEPEWTQDLLQRLYELIIPRNLRHGLGEYYTPSWLASHLIDRAGYKGDPETRFLDPACGSGTFLVEALKRTVRRARSCEPHELKPFAEKVLDNIVGFDLNPLAVLAARTNYLIALAPLLQYVRPVSIPVYLCDSVLPPERDPEAEATLFREDTVVFTTHDENYVFPTAMKSKRHIDTFTGAVMTALRAKTAPEQFGRSLPKTLGLESAEIVRLREIYRKIKALDDAGKDGIWAHYIKNAFAPVYLRPFDFVIGNPPWIRWGYLSDEYRKRTLRLWHEYGLFSLKGHETRLGAGEKDFSMLFTYACADRYLKTGGTLGFVITQEVFKSKGAGEGFRRFRIGEKGEPLKILRMEDMVHLQPFHAANKTAIFTLRKGKPTRYPVAVVEWKRKKGVGRVPPEWTPEQVKAATTRTRLKAIPVEPQKPVSSWQTGKPADLDASKKLKGEDPYKAYRGASTEPYGVFWLRLKELRPDGLIVVENQHDRGKRKVPPVEDAIEPTLVYPAVSGGHLTRFGTKAPVFVLMAQDPATRKPYPEDWMQEHAPLTYAYLAQFRDILLSRGSAVVRNLAEKTEFYAMYGIGDYSFASWRVAWKRMAAKMAAAVLSAVETPFGRKPVIGTDTTSFFVARTKAEAHYLCALLNSDVVDGFIRSFSSGGRGFGAPSVVKNLAIPPFDKYNDVHIRLSALSRGAHTLVRNEKDTAETEAEINEAARTLWNITS